MCKSSGYRSRLSRRPYMLVGFFHLILGFLLFACGAVWLLMTFLYWPKQLGHDTAYFSQENVWTKDMGTQAWTWFVYTCQIWTGFWMMLTGSFAMCVSDRGHLERLFIFFNVTTIVIFAPAAFVLSTELLFNVVSNLQQYSFIYQKVPNQNAAGFFTQWSLNKDTYAWILTFPIVGLAIGFIEFVLGIVCCCVIGCCRPTRSYSY